MLLVVLEKCVLLYRMQCVASPQTAVGSGCSLTPTEISKDLMARWVVASEVTCFAIHVLF